MKMTLDDIKKDDKLRRSFLREYSRISGKEVCDCKGKLSTYYSDYLTIKNMSNSNYKLRDGALVWVSSMNMYVSNDNLTDEIAQKMLSQSRAFSKDFVQVPNIETPVKTVKEKDEMTYEEKLLSVKGIGKGYAKRIIELHPNEASLIEAITEGADTGVDEQFNNDIIEAFV